ncbi:MAG: hypothetical protein L7W43_19690 [Rubripirellula sp.]|nr:hypothetical protein [Rubripirellula sp.]
MPKWHDSILFAGRSGLSISPAASDRPLQGTDVLAALEQYILGLGVLGRPVLRVEGVSP